MNLFTQALAREHACICAAPQRDKYTFQIHTRLYSDWLVDWPQLVSLCICVLILYHLYLDASSEWCEVDARLHLKGQKWHFFTTVLCTDQNKVCLEPRLPLPPLSAPSALLRIEDLQSVNATSPLFWNVSSTRSVTYNVRIPQVWELLARFLSSQMNHYVTRLKCVSGQVSWFATTSSLSVVSLEVTLNPGRLWVNVSFHHFALNICRLAEAFCGGWRAKGSERRAEAAMHVNVNKESEISRGCEASHYTPDEIAPSDQIYREISSDSSDEFGSLPLKAKLLPHKCWEKAGFSFPSMLNLNLTVTQSFHRSKFVQDFLFSLMWSIRTKLKK